MSTLEDIRSTLSTGLGAVSGLSSYEVVPGRVNTPAAVVAPDNIEYSADFDGSATYRLPVQILVSLGDWGTAQRDLDRFVAHDGPAVAAIHALAIEARVIGMEAYGLTQFAGTDYLGAQLIVEVFA